MDQTVKEVGYVAAKIMLSSYNNPSYQYSSTPLPVKLIKRDSAKKIC